MKREDFISRRDKYGKLAPVLILAGAAVGLGWMYLCLAVLGKSFLKDLPWYWQGLGIVVSVGPMFLGIGIGSWLPGRIAGVDCPHCSKLINRGFMGYLVVSTDRCPHCGETVITDRDDA